MKKGFLITMLVVMLVLATSTVAWARYSYIDEITADIGISGSTATVGGTVFAKASNSITVSVELQQLQTNGTWKTLQTWSGTKTALSNKVTGSRSVDTGGTYRAKVTGTILGESGYSYTQ